MLPILFSIGPFHLYSLSIFLILAWCIWSFLFWKKLRSLAIEESRIFDLMFFMTLAAFVGARASYVLFNPQYFTRSWLLVFTVWIQPGLTILGAIMSAVILLFFLVRIYKLVFVDVFSAFIAAFLPAYIIGSIGSLLDGSVVGKQAEKLPWLVRYVGHMGFRHPVQMYGIITVLIVIGITLFLRRFAKKYSWNAYIIPFIGVLFFFLSMFVLEFVTERSVYWFKLSASSWVYGVFIFAGGVYAAISSRFVRRHQNPS